MHPKFVTNHPALLLGRTLVIADLHIGMERELAERGIRIAPQWESMCSRITEIIGLTRAKKLLILGDVKHMIPNIAYREYEDIPKLMEKLSETVRVEVVPGNHDGGLKKLIPDVIIHPSAGTRIKNIYLNHGHTWPSDDLEKCDYLIIAHNHPFIEFRDALGFRALEQAWIKCKLRKKELEKKYKNAGKLALIIMPAFNHLVGGVVFNKEVEFLGPLMKLINIEKSKAYLLDGTLLGELKGLRKLSKVCKESVRISKEIW